MSLRRLHVSTLPGEGDEIVLQADAARHARVLRLSVGDALMLFDGRGGQAKVEILSSTPAFTCVVKELLSEDPERTRVILCQALPKGTKLESIVRMSTEIGVAAIHLMVTKRVISRPDPARMERRMTRLSKIAQEAARQSGRAHVPPLLTPQALSEVAARPEEGALKLVLDPANGDSLLDRVALTPRPREIWLAVGPEGGLSEAELATLHERGFVGASLGPHTLRVETAAPMAVALASLGARSSERPA